MINIDIDASDVLAGLGALDGNDWMRAPMEGSLALLIDGMATYPPPPATSRYRRTGTLGRTWTSSIRGNGQGLTGEIGNNTPYGPYVQDHERQAHWMEHWQTDEQVATENESAILQLFEQAAERAFE